MEKSNRSNILMIGLAVSVLLIILYVVNKQGDTTKKIDESAFSKKAEGTGSASFSGRTWQEPLSGVEFVEIPSGCFQMGSKPSENRRHRNEGPVHEVCVDSFWMGKYEVTQQQWEKVMGSNPSVFKKGAAYPVENISWYDSQDFLEKLNIRNTDRVFRLPTEAEWEYAARAGTETPYYFGETISTDQANFDGKGTMINGKPGVYRKSTMPVGSFQANNFGLFDMHGNVGEWCSDFYAEEYYKESPKRNPQGPDSGTKRILRGGHLYDREKYIRSAYRDTARPDNPEDAYGIRVVFTMKKE